MSWLFSRALAAEYLAATCSDGAPFAPLSGNPTPQAYLPPDRMTAFSRLSRFGMTYAPLTESHGADLLTWYLAAFPAKTYRPQGGVRASMVPDLAYGEKWPELSVRYDPDSSSWKTHRCLWEEDLPWSSVTLPKWGMTHTGLVYRHPTAERPISGIGSGLWPTPTVHGNHNRPYPGKQSGFGLSTAVKEWPTPCATDTADRAIHGEVHITRSGLPKHIAKAGGKSQMRLSQAVKLWPTPTCACGGKEVVSSQKFNNLVAFAKMFPTPTATDGKGAPTLEAVRARALNSTRGVRLPEQLARDGTIGQLNPMWVEWLMGWPLGWTDLKPLEMGKFREWQQQHSLCSLHDEIEDAA